MSLILTTGVLETGTKIAGIGAIQDGTGDGGGGSWYIFAPDSAFLNLYNRGSSIIGWSFYTTGSPGTAVTITGLDPIGQYSLAFNGLPSLLADNFTAQSPDYGIRAQGFTIGPGVVLDAN